MTNEPHTHSDEAEAIRTETADGAPELADHDRLTALEAELDDAKSKALYAAAELQNARRRMDKELADTRTYAVANFARDMLSVKDHFERALAAVGEELRADKVAANFLAGIEATARELDAILTRHGVEKVPAKGLPLDPNHHQAMMEMPSDEHEPGTVIEEMQAGYKLKDRLLRPALVGVARKG